MIAQCARQPATALYRNTDEHFAIHNPARSIIGMAPQQMGTSMMSDWFPTQIPSDPQGRRILDKAEGILMGLRRCSSQVAFEELLGAAQRHGIPVFNLAWALVHIASAKGKSPQKLCSAQAAAAHEWGRLLVVPAV